MSTYSSHLHAAVMGEGPSPCLLMIVGEGPGKDEARTGRPFVGRSGSEVDRFLFYNSLERDFIHVTNLTRYYNPDGDVTQADIRRDEHLLVRDLVQVRPRFILTLGRHSTRWFLGDVDMETVHGLPHRLDSDTLGSGIHVGGIAGTIIVPGYHPAAGFYAPEVQALIAYDFRQFAATIRGQVKPHKLMTDPPYYRELTDTDVNNLSEDLYPGASLRGAREVALDTEGEPGHEWGLSYSTRPGTAYVIHRSQQEMLGRFLLQLRKYRPEVIFHNALYDLEMLRGLGVDILQLALIIHDTMVMAYNLCVEPQGLKPLAYRHCGLKLGSYEELIAPAKMELWWEWLVGVYSCAYEQQWTGKKKRKLVDVATFPRPETRLIREGINYRPYQPMSASAWAKKLFEEITEGKLKKDGTTITALDIGKRWRDMDVENRKIVMERCGPLPVITLDHVRPRRNVIQYAGGDANATLQLYPILREKVEAIRV
jgi:uracil-DNA glycosylase family 4